MSSVDYDYRSNTHSADRSYGRASVGISRWDADEHR